MISKNILMLLGLSGLHFMAACKQNQNSSSNGPSPYELNGHEVGNGGDAVICLRDYPELAGRRVLLLDHFEAINRWSLPPILGDIGLSVDEKVQLVITRIEKIDPDRAAILRSFQQSFWSEAEVLRNAHLPDIPDDGPLSLPGSDCRLEQAAIRQEPELPGDKRYLISGEVWEQLDDDGKAGLVLHEIIYREAVTHGHLTSSKARYYHALASGDVLQAMSREQYVELMDNTVKLPTTYTYRDIRFAMRGIQFHPDGNVALAELEEQKIDQFGFTYTTAGTQVTFDSEGNLEYTAPVSAVFPTAPGWGESCMIKLGESHRVKIGPSGVVRAISALVQGSRAAFLLPICRADIGPVGQPVILASSSDESPGAVTFDEQGIPIGVLTNRSQFDHATNGCWTLKTLDGLEVDQCIGDSVSFTASGMVDVTIPAVDLVIDRPSSSTNTISGDDQIANGLIENQAQATALYEAMSGLSVHPEPDAETRFFAMPRRGLSIVCKRWIVDDVKACTVRVNERFSSGLNADGVFERKSDSTGWIWTLHHRRFQWPWLSFQSGQKFVDGFHGAPVDSADCHGSASLAPKSVEGDGFVICTGRDFYSNPEIKVILTPFPGP